MQLERGIREGIIEKLRKEREERGDEYPRAGSLAKKSVDNDGTDIGIAAASNDTNVNARGDVVQIYSDNNNDISSNSPTAADPALQSRKRRRVALERGEVEEKETDFIRVENTRISEEQEEEEEEVVVEKEILQLGAEERPEVIIYDQMGPLPSYLKA